jgi:hypothetical protein
MANLSSTGTMTTERLTSPSHRIRDDERGRLSGRPFCCRQICIILLVTYRAV